jgi:hypothetical protein
MSNNGYTPNSIMIRSEDIKIRQRLDSMKAHIPRRKYCNLPQNAGIGLYLTSQSQRRKQCIPRTRPESYYENKQFKHYVKSPIALGLRLLIIPFLHEIQGQSHYYDLYRNHYRCRVSCKVYKEIRQDMFFVEAVVIVGNIRRRSIQ